MKRSRLKAIDIMATIDKSQIKIYDLARESNQSHAPDQVVNENAEILGKVTDLQDPQIETHSIEPLMVSDTLDGTGF